MPVMKIMKMHFTNHTSASLEVTNSQWTGQGKKTGHLCIMCYYMNLERWEGWKLRIYIEMAGSTDAKPSLVVNSRALVMCRLGTCG